MIKLGKRIYEEATLGTPWSVAGEAAGFSGPNVGERARRLASKYARTYGKEWPLEKEPPMESDGTHEPLPPMEVYSFTAPSPEPEPEPELKVKAKAKPKKPKKSKAKAKPKKPKVVAKKPEPKPKAATTPPEKDRHFRRKETGRKVYEMRTARMPWSEVLEALGVGKNWAHRMAQQHAYANNLPWPIVFPENDLLKRAYDLRCSGLSWKEVSEKEGIAMSSATSRAQRYAEAHGLPWPPKMRPVRRTYSEKAKQAYEMGYVEKVPWVEVAEQLGYASCQACLNSAKAYANRAGLPYPKRKVKGKGKKKSRNPVRDSSRMRRAYELRRDTDMTWAQISFQVGYQSMRAAYNAAFQYAGENNLSWPPDKDPAGSSQA